MKLLDIFDFCEKEVKDYVFVPEVAQLLGPKGKAAVFMGMNGVQVIFSFKSVGNILMLHLSFSPILSINPSFESLDVFKQYVYENGGSIAKTFAPNRVFAREPECEKNPQVMHFFSIIDD